MAHTDPFLSVAGAGVAELPIPRRIKWIRAWTTLGILMLPPVAAFAWNGWAWLAQGTATSLAVGLGVSTAGAGLVFWLLRRTGIIHALLSLKKREGRWYYNGYRESWRLVLAVVFLGATWTAIGSLILWAVKACPLPRTLAVVRIDIQPPRPNEGLMPIYFWDYATWIDPAWLNELMLVVPYEKGPPQKLLAKIYFYNEKTKTIELELHGRRPRSYAAVDVRRIFELPVAQPSDWPLLWKLQNEAGVSSTPTLYLARLNQGSSNVTQAIGVPWQTASTNVAAGRFFFWGPDGSVFQTKCPAPCKMARLLELVQFPSDPRASWSERKEWTADTLKKLLDAVPDQNLDRRRHENLMMLYLVSLLTLDPRDPEAFFHLGKMARDHETALAAMRYGRDLGLEAAKVVELEAVAQKLAQ